MTFIKTVVLKDKLTGRTLVVQENEKKKIEILLYAGWVIVEEEQEGTKTVAPPSKVEESELLIAMPVEEPSIVEPDVPESTAVELPVVDSEPVVGEIVEEIPEFPEPATEPRKAKMLTPKVKKTLKLPNDYA